MPGGQQAARFVWIVMPGERVVWIPPERLCTGTKGWKRSSVTLEIRVEGWEWGGGGGEEEGRYMGEVELKRLHL